MDSEGEIVITCVATSTRDTHSGYNENHLVASLGEALESFSQCSNSLIVVLEFVNLHLYNGHEQQVTVGGREGIPEHM